MSAARPVWIACADCGIAYAQMPFIKKAPRVSFRKPIGSVSVSGHKFIGAPVPCGVVITRQKVRIHHAIAVTSVRHYGRMSGQWPCAA